MNEIFRMQNFHSFDAFACNPNQSFQIKSLIAKNKEIKKTGTENIHYHAIVITFDTKIVNLSKPNFPFELFNDFGFIMKHW